MEGRWTREGSRKVDGRGQEDGRRKTEEGG